MASSGDTNLWMKDCGLAARCAERLCLSVESVLEAGRLRLRRGGVIDNPILGAVWRDPRRPEKDHHVIRKLLHPGLIKEKQIAGLRFPDVAGNKHAVEILERSAVGEF